MKKLFFIATLLAFANIVTAQKYFTRSGKITFSSDAPLEKIEAENSSATSVIDIESGKMEFAVLIKAFQFEKALMQEHFNENYMESSKFPKATFKGQIQNLEAINFDADGTYKANVKGDMTIHGVTKNIDTQGTFTVKDGKIFAASTFSVLVADYEIKIPNVVKDNIAKEVAIDVTLTYQELKKGS